MTKPRVVCLVGPTGVGKSAIALRLAGVVYGAADNKAGAVESCFNGLDLPFHNHRVWHMGGIAAPECASLLQKFFQKSR